MELNIKDMIVKLLTNSDTTINKLYQFINGQDSVPSKSEFDKFKNSLIASVKHKKENALELFPIIKYFEQKRMTDDDYDYDNVIFTLPSDEKIAIASPIEILDEVPDSSKYNQKIEWDLTHIEERESLIEKSTLNFYRIIKDMENIKKAVFAWGRYVEENLYIEKIEKDFFKSDIPQEVFALNQSDDLNNLLPTELVQLDDPELEFIFYKNFVEKKLLSYQLWGIERQIIEDIQISKQDFEDRGPLFICIDTSGSMRGIKEVVSKAIALAAVHILEKLGVNVILIPFSTKCRSLDLEKSKSKVNDAKKFLSKSFYGGSDFGKLIDHLMKYINDRKYQKTNIVIFSDFIFKNIDPSIKLKIKKIENDHHTFHSLKISKENNKNSVEKYFSSNWQYIFNWKGMEEEISEDDLIKELAEANIVNGVSVGNVSTFGFIKKIKDYDFAKKKAKNNPEQENDESTNDNSNNTNQNVEQDDE